MRFCKLTKLPAANSPEMRAYMAALLEVSGMMSRQGFALTEFLGNLRTHLEPKASYPYAALRVEADGLAYLTEEGHRFFASRLTIDPASMYLKFRHAPSCSNDGNHGHEIAVA